MTITQLSSGWWRISGEGPCNWTQVPCWPTTEQEIREHAFPEASEGFLREAIAESERSAKTKDSLPPSSEDDLLPELQAILRSNRMALGKSAEGGQLTSSLAEKERRIAMFNAALLLLRAELEAKKLDLLARAADTRATVAHGGALRRR